MYLSRIFLTSYALKNTRLCEADRFSSYFYPKDVRILIMNQRNVIDLDLTEFAVGRILTSKHESEI